MLSIVNPLNMAMNVSCCQWAPFCAHSRHPQSQSQTLPSLSLGHFGDSGAFNNQIASQSQASYGYHRPSQVPLYPSQTLSLLNDQDKFRTSSSMYSTPILSSTWNAPTYPAPSHEYNNTHWLLSRSKDGELTSGPSSFANDDNEYLASLKYDSRELRDISPSRGTDFSAVSASSNASPVPAASYLGSLRLPRDDSPFLSSQILHPEHLRAAHDDTRRLSTASHDSNSPLRHARSRSRKNSEVMHCHICAKTFDRRSNFKSHWETHDKDRHRIPCKMDGCGKTFGRPAEMTRHVNSAHRQKSFPCNSCGKEFTRHDILLRHCKDACPILVKGKRDGKKRRGISSD